MVMTYDMASCQFIEPEESIEQAAHQAEQAELMPRLQTVAEAVAIEQAEQPMQGLIAAQMLSNGSTLQD